MTTRRKLFRVVLVILGVAVACCLAFTAAFVLTPTTTVLVEVTATPTETSVHVPTSVSEAKVSPTPTIIPSPVPTNAPEPTSTPEPEPIILSGSGDSVVDFDMWDIAGLAHITYSGEGNFAVWNWGVDGERIDLLVNTIGQYEGTRPLDFRDGEQTGRFQITASGPWVIEILPLSRAKRVAVPTTFGGTGDDVILLGGLTPDLLKVDASSAQSNFAIWGYSHYVELLVNEIAPYEGVVAISNETITLAITAEGPWSIEVTAR